jgi:hypothetical protein
LTLSAVPRCRYNKHIRNQPMTATFAEYAAQQDARNTIQLNVVKWTWMLCDALRDAAPDGYDYIFESGRKYHKVIMIDSSGGRSVHAFVDRKTGEIYKSSSWKSPAKGVRYDLRSIEQREWLFEHADWAGGYLYAR